MLTTDDPEELARTRDAWHTLAERVVAPARQRVTERIGLQPAPGGFGTGPLPASDEVRVEGTELVVGARRAPITTLGAAAAFAGLDRPADPGVYPATTPDDPDLALTVAPAQAAVLADWFAFGAITLGRWVEEIGPGESPSDAQLWPEHFDLALTLGPAGHLANYGASPGDGANPLPYLYVGPHEPRPDPFWDAGTYARLGASELARASDPVGRALEFFATGHALA